MISSSSGIPVHKLPSYIPISTIGPDRIQMEGHTVRIHRQAVVHHHLKLAHLPGLSPSDRAKQTGIGNGSDGDHVAMRDLGRVDDLYLH